MVVVAIVVAVVVMVTGIRKGVVLAARCLHSSLLPEDGSQETIY